jgi:hypothetical protein
VLLEALAPDQIKIAVAALDQIAEETRRLEHQWALRRERARFEAERARCVFRRSRPCIPTRSRPPVPISSRPAYRNEAAQGSDLKPPIWTRLMQVGREDLLLNSWGQVLPRIEVNQSRQGDGCEPWRGVAGRGCAAPPWRFIGHLNGQALVSTISCTRGFRKLSPVSSTR